MSTHLRVSASSLVLMAAASCTSTQPVTNDTIVQDATTQARQICSFVPTAQTILSLLGTGQSHLAVASGIAKAICDAVAPQGQPNRASGTPVVQGVPIEGGFVQK